MSMEDASLREIEAVHRAAEQLAGRVGLDLEQWRAEQGLQLAQLARLLETSISQVSRYCSGESMLKDDAFTRAMVVSNGRIGLYALHIKRMRWLRTHRPNRRFGKSELQTDLQVAS